MKKILYILLVTFVLFLLIKPSQAALIVVGNEVDSGGEPFWYYYELRYPLDIQETDPALSHWWLEVDSAHESIDEESIFGFSEIEGDEYDWQFEFAENLGQVGGYTDWVIKWNAEDEEGESIEPSKDPGGLIGSFGFYSFQPPTIGNWGGKSGQLFDTGTTQIPLSLHSGNVIPEPTSLSLLGLGLLGLLTRKKLRTR